MHFLLLQPCFELSHASVTVSYHIPYEGLSSFYEAIVHFTTTHTKDKNECYSKLKQRRVKCDLFNYVWIEAYRIENGEGSNTG